MSLRDTPRLVEHALHLTSRIVESDTDTSVIDLNLLENLNTNQLLNYIKLEQSMNDIDKSASRYAQATAEFRALQRQLDEIEQLIDVVTAVVGELDQWAAALIIAEARGNETNP